LIYCLINMEQWYGLSVSEYSGVEYQSAHCIYTVEELDCCFHIFFGFKGNV
jgi:hypothetical protein